MSIDGMNFDTVLAKYLDTEGDGPVATHYDVGSVDLDSIPPSEISGIDFSSSGLSDGDLPDMADIDTLSSTLPPTAPDSPSYPLDSDDTLPSSLIALMDSPQPPTVIPHPPSVTVGLGPGPLEPTVSDMIAGLNVDDDTELSSVLAYLEKDAEEKTRLATELAAESAAMDRNMTDSRRFRKNQKIDERPSNRLRTGTGRDSQDSDTGSGGGSGGSGASGSFDSDSFDYNSMTKPEMVREFRAMLDSTRVQASMEVDRIRQWYVSLLQKRNLEVLDLKEQFRDQKKMLRDEIIQVEELKEENEMLRSSLLQQRELGGKEELVDSQHQLQHGHGLVYETDDEDDEFVEIVSEEEEETDDDDDETMVVVEDYDDSEEEEEEEDDIGIGIGIIEDSSEDSDDDTFIRHPIRLKRRVRDEVGKPPPKRKRLRIRPSPNRDRNRGRGRNHNYEARKLFSDESTTSASTDPSGEGGLFPEPEGAEFFCCVCLVAMIVLYVGASG